MNEYDDGFIDDDMSEFTNKKLLDLYHLMKQYRFESSDGTNISNSYKRLKIIR